MLFPRQEKIHRKTVLPLFPSWTSLPFHLMGCYFQHRARLCLRSTFKQGREGRGGGSNHSAEGYEPELEVRVRYKVKFSRVRCLFSCFYFLWCGMRRQPQHGDNSWPQQGVCPGLQRETLIPCWEVPSQKPGGGQLYLKGLLTSIIFTSAKQNHTTVKNNYLWISLKCEGSCVMWNANVFLPWDSLSLFFSPSLLFPLHRCP